MAASNPTNARPSALEVLQRLQTGLWVVIIMVWASLAGLAFWFVKKMGGKPKKAEEAPPEGQVLGATNQQQQGMVNHQQNHQQNHQPQRPQLWGYLPLDYMTKAASGSTFFRNQLRLLVQDLLAHQLGQQGARGPPGPPGPVGPQGEVSNIQP